MFILMLLHFSWIPCQPAHDVPVPGAQPARHGGTASEDGDHGSQGLRQDSQDAGNSQYLGGNNRAPTFATFAGTGIGLGMLTIYNLH